MSIVVLQLPDVKRKTETRPKKCRYCPGETFQRWGRVKKPVRDNRVSMSNSDAGGRSWVAAGHVLGYAAPVELNGGADPGYAAPGSVES